VEGGTNHTDEDKEGKFGSGSASESISTVMPANMVVHLNNVASS
jgi:hypothetical protein